MRNTCEIIHLLTDSNPIQVIVDAIIKQVRRHPPLRADLAVCGLPTLSPAM